MDNQILFLHILTALLYIGPTTVANSLFPKYAQVENRNLLVAFNRISKICGFLSLLVPITGIILTAKYDLFKEVWINVSLGLSILIALIMIVFILPIQKLAINGKIKENQRKSLHFYSAMVTLSWITILYEMIFH